MSRVHENLPEAVQTFSRVLAIHDALPERFKPSDATPLREILPGIWPTVADLRALVEWGAASPSPQPKMLGMADLDGTHMCEGCGTVLHHGGHCDCSWNRSIVPVREDRL